MHRGWDRLASTSGEDRDTDALNRSVSDQPPGDLDEGLQSDRERGRVEIEQRCRPETGRRGGIMWLGELTLRSTRGRS